MTGKFATYLPAESLLGDSRGKLPNGLTVSSSSMPRSAYSWFPRTAAGMAALGVNASLLSHVLAVGVVLLAPWAELWSSRDPDAVKLSGRRGVILIQAAFAEPEP